MMFFYINIKSINKKINSINKILKILTKKILIIIKFSTQR